VAQPETFAIPHTEPVRPSALVFDTAFEALRPSLARVCASLVGPDDAEDVVQDTYLRARSRLRQLRDPALLNSWLYRIAVNLCYGWHRRRRLADLLGSTTNRATSGSDLGLRELIEELPARERTVLVLHYGHGYRLDEIADLLSLNYATVRTIVARTRRRLYWAITEAER
jgi:RNA polymerase sigma-70 factor, ECF subfamily